MTSSQLMGVTRAVMGQANKAVLLADSSKFARRGTFRVADCSAFACLVTEEVPPEAAWVRDAFPKVATRTS